MNKIIRIGTRKSALALAQTELVAEALKAAQPGITVELVTKVTEGDRILNKPLLEFGGKGVFVTEFEQALLSGEIDFAVHSAKDLPMELEDGLAIVAVPPREDPRDVLVTMAGTDLSGREYQEKGEIVIGTSSLRRKLLIEELGKEMWPGASVRCENLRGNVQTRLGKLEAGCHAAGGLDSSGLDSVGLDSGGFDGIILAAAGLKRLGIEKDRKYDYHYFDCETFIPAGGQGIMAVEGRADDRVGELGVRIQDEEARLCLVLERRILRLLDAGCHEPIGVYSRLLDGQMEVFGISRRKEETKRIHMSGGTDKIELLAEQAAKGLR